MKLRSALLACAFLLLIGSLASASSPASANAPASTPEVDVAFMTPADGEAGCAKEELAFLNPAPSERATGFCGTCSSTNCRGGSIGQRCGFSGGRWYTCQYPYAEFCTDGTRKCYCWTGPLP
jgi:hypothetical protein